MKSTPMVYLLISTNLGCVCDSQSYHFFTDM